MTKKLSSSPYQQNISNNYNTSVSVASFGKSIRKEISTTYFPKNNFYTLHFVVCGEANYIHNNKEHKLSANSMLIVSPNNFCELTITKPPYINYWLNLTGIEVSHLFSNMNINDEPIIQIKENLANVFEQIHIVHGPQPYQQLQMLSFVYKILSSVMRDCNKPKKLNYKEYYAKSFTNYIESNYNNENTQIADIAKYIGISACQLYRIITDEYGISPVKYLTEYRINMSKIYLKNDLKISQISKLCGFSDPLYFSRVFYKSCGMSPSEYKKSKYN